jgi:hypothetical protein
MRYNKFLGLKEVNKAILMMKYNSSLTLNENELFINEQGGIGGAGVSDWQVKAQQENITKIQAEKERQQQLKKDFDSKFIIIKIPKNDFGVDNLTIPKGSGIKLWDKNTSRVNSFFKSWFGTDWERYLPKEDDLKYIFPDNTLRSFTVPDGTSYTSNLERVSDNPITWKFKWYYDDNGNPYNQKKELEGTEIPEDYLYKEDGFWDKWGPWILAGLSVLATILFPGAVGIWLSVGIDMIGAVQSLAEGDKMGALVSTILAFLPVGLGKIPGIGTITKEEAINLANKFAKATDEAQISNIYSKLSTKEQKYFQTVFSQDPEKIVKELDNVMFQKIVKGIPNQTYNAKELVDTINSMISSGKLKYDDMVRWYQKANIKRFGIDLGTTGLILGGTYAYGKYQQAKQTKQVKDLSSKAVSEPYKFNDDKLEQKSKEMDDEWNEEENEQ